MSEDKHIGEQLPFYAAGTLSGAEAARLEVHLESCPDCQAELALWLQVRQSIATANQAVKAPIFSQLRQPRTVGPLARPMPAWWALISSQLRLLRGELWTASLLIIAIGLVVSILLDKQAVLYGAAPLVTAAGAAMLYGYDNDPALELILSTPINQVQILLARLTLVLGYDLLLVLAGSGVLLAIRGIQPWGSLISAWLAPMAFLAALALFLSLLAGTANAVSIAYGLWILRYLAIVPEAQRIAPGLAKALARFWAMPSLLFSVALVVTLGSLLLVRYPQLLPDRFNPLNQH